MELNAFIRRFSIRSRMLASVGFVAAVLTCIGGAGWLGLSKVAQSVDLLVDGALADANKLGALQLSLQAISLREKDMVIHFNAPDEVGALRKQWHQAIRETREAAKKLGGEPGSARAAAAKAIEQTLFVYERYSSAEADGIEGGIHTSAKDADQALARARKHSQKAQEQLAELGRLVNEAANAQRDHSEAVRATVTYVFASVVGGALLLIVPLTLFNMKSICEPMDQACDLAGRIAAGDLTTQIESRGADEPARLMTALKHMQQSLGAMVVEVRDRTDSMRTACGEVAAGNQDLSSRTEQTACSLQQTSSSMEQLTGTVRQTADSARMANELACAAAQAAKRGGDVVSQVVSNMGEISNSSRRIADITGVIDGIAFQTNILALNAAVEAARAGEEGRGFAVVATEVRSLAQRSAGAAREIKSLISGSVEKVDSGSRLVQHAGSTMDEIVQGVQQVTQIIAEITAATTGQSNELVQVNTAVTQLDQMTQQNAALVEQSAAAAASLNSQAERLSHLVARFRCMDAPAEATAADSAAIAVPARG